MTLQEAIHCCVLVEHEDLWMRPTGMKGEALAVNGDFLYWRPVSGGDVRYTPSVRDICRAWETVKPTDVIRER